MLGFVGETLTLTRGRTGEILASLGITPNKRGAHILCPFPSHPDRNPSWRWDSRTERWFCTCGRGHGDILDLVVQIGQASTSKEAAIYVRQVLGLPGANVRDETPEQAAARREKLRAQLRENEQRKAEADAEYDAETARRLAFARDLYAGGQP